MWKRPFGRLRFLRDQLRLIGEGQTDGVIADVIGPGGDQLAETAAVVCKERPRGFFEARQVAGDGRHESISRFLGGADAVAIAARAPRFVNQPAQRDRRAPGLEIQPVPMARQERDLFRDDTQARASPAARLNRGRFGSARSIAVEVDLRASGVVENQDFALRSRPKEDSEFFGGPRGDALESMKSCVGHEINIPG
jgi:hypothetical protein